MAVSPVHFHDTRVPWGSGASTPRKAVHRGGEAVPVWLQEVRVVRRVFQNHTENNNWRTPEPCAKRA